MALSSSTLQFVLLLAVYGYQYQSKCYGTPPSPFLPLVLTVLGCTTKDIPNGHPVTWSPDGSDHPKTKQWLAAKFSIALESAVPDLKSQEVKVGLISLKSKKKLPTG
ncbi:hypothetical protein FB451DRAFT_1164275 [Mycena latifolia]|nr:hypothetical protein FB451DRAFT_1164275 [Mycena latifolia]